MNESNTQGMTKCSDGLQKSLATDIRTYMSEAATKTERPGPAISRSIVDIVADLEKPVSDRHIHSRTQGGKAIKFIAWYNAERYLDYFAAGWKKEIREVIHIPADDAGKLTGKLAMTIRLIIPCLEGEVYRDATGYEDDDKSGFGDPFSNAESMALRRAAANFGLGRYLYDK